MSLRSTNLNLIPVLRALLKEASVSAAAKSVGLSQPATSNALARLRILLGDPLLYRVGQHMTLTPRARRMAASLEQVCRALEEILDEPEFDPSRAERTFVVAAPDYVATLLGAYFAERLPALAPGASLRFIEAPMPLAPALTAGEVDLGIFRWVEGLEHEGLSAVTGYRDRMVGVVRQGHPLGGRIAPTAEELAGFVQVRQQRSSIPGPHLQSWPNLPGPIRVTSPHFVGSVVIAAKSSSFTVAPSSLVEFMKGGMALDTFELREEAGPGFESAMLWGGANDEDPPHRWFRGLVDAAMRAQTLPGDRAN